jgi:hypothetical protein
MCLFLAAVAIVCCAPVWGIRPWMLRELAVQGGRMKKENEEKRVSAS